MTAASSARTLTTKELRWTCDPASLSFETTSELADLDAALGQERAVEAVSLAIAMPHRGFNLFALGSSGRHKHRLVQRLLETEAANRPTPSDWCYVNNFDDPHRPPALRFPTGRGRQFRDDLDLMVEALPDALRAAFQTDEYTTRRQMLEQELKERQEHGFAKLEEEARRRGIALLRTPMGLTLAPVREGKVLTPEAFEALPESERKRLESDIGDLQERLQEVFRNIPDWLRAAHDKIQQLNGETADYAVGHLIDELRGRYADIEGVPPFLEELKADIIFNAPVLLQAPRSGAPGANHGEGAIGDGAGTGLALLRRYRANLVVDCGGAQRAPVVYEDEPSYDRLVGRIEHRAEMGALVTDFHLIRPGALHRANGGYLLLDARKVLMRPYAWEALKRCLRAEEVRIEGLAHALGFGATVSLEPDAIPLDVKVALVGDRMLYYLLSALDPEFGDLFKIAADFNEDVARAEGSTQDYARFVATLVRRYELKPFGRDGVAAVLEFAARRAGDSERLTTDVEAVADLLREANLAADKAGSDLVTAAHVDAALAAQERRSDRVRNLLHEAIRRGTLLIDSDGARIGQINGLAVFGTGVQSFGQPMRITARVHLGRGDVVDIDREVELGGPIHAKGVLILSGFLKARYAVGRPLSLGASLVFEQSYGGVEGDSASVAELCVLLSAIAEAPIDQGLAVTGSVNQHGDVQAIGGVNEKIEGFFDVCAARGLTGRQGVLIPASNVKHLMLHRRVVEAVEQGRFRISAVESIDQAITLLIGIAAGEEGPDGHYPEGSLNRRVADRLAAMAEQRRAYGLPDRRNGGQDG